MRGRRFRNVFMTFLFVLTLLGIVGSAYAYLQIGRTPGELLDYADKRLQGHPNLEQLVAPLFSLIRQLTNQPAELDRLKLPFVIPTPPLLVIDQQQLARLTAPDANVIRVGDGQAVLTIAEAARVAKDGDVVEIIAGNYYGDVALWLQRRLTIRAVGGRARIYANGKAAEGKAIWVFRNGDFTVENIEFIEAKVADRNGAGIRAEAGSLTVSNCLFFGNQNGILTTAELLSLDVQRSEFAYNGDGDGYSHAIYVGAIAQFRALGNYFHHANRGHLIKSRAEKSVIAYNRITDEIDGRASYEIDLPNGGDAVVAFNIVQQSSSGENSALISFGAEGLRWQSNQLWLEKNTLVNDNPWGGTMLRVASGVDKVTAVNNLILGLGGIQSAAKQTIVDNVDAQWSWFEMPQRFDYRLKMQIPLVEEAYARPTQVPAAGYYIEHSDYQVDATADQFAGALPVVRASF